MHSGRMTRAAYWRAALAVAIAFAGLLLSMSSASADHGTPPVGGCDVDPYGFGFSGDLHDADVVEVESIAIFGTYLSAILGPWSPDPGGNGDGWVCSPAGVEWWWYLLFWDNDASIPVPPPPEPENSPPTADAGNDQTLEWTPGGVSVTLDGSGSSDPDSDPLSYEWSGSFGIVTGESPTVVFTSLGVYTVTLTVGDGEESDSATVVVTVEDTTAPTPTAKLVHLNGNSYIVTFGCTDTCDASPSTAATLNGTPVANGQEVLLVQSNGKPQAMPIGQGITKFLASSFLLEVTCTDSSGNVGTAGAAE